MEKNFKKIWQKLTAFLIVTVLSLSLMPIIQAQVTLPERYRPSQSPILKEKGKNFDVESLGYILQLLSSTLLYAAGAIAILLLVFNGFRYVSAGGESGTIDSAKKSIMWTLAGLLIAIFSIVIVQNVITWIFRLQQT